MGERAEQRESETGIVGDVVAPRDPALLEDGLPEPLLGEGNGARRDRLEQMLGHVVRRDRLEAGSVRVDQVGGHGPGAGQVRQLAADPSQGLGKIQGPPDHLGDRQERGRLAEPRLQGPLGRGQPSDHRLEGLGQICDLLGPALRNRPCRVARGDGARSGPESRDGSRHVRGNDNRQRHRREESQYRPDQQAPVGQVQVLLNLGMSLGHQDLPTDIGHGRETRKTRVTPHPGIARNLAEIAGSDDGPDRQLGEIPAFPDVGRALVREDLAPRRRQERIPRVAEADPVGEGLNGVEPEPGGDRSPESAGSVRDRSADRKTEAALADAADLDVGVHDDPAALDDLAEPRAIGQVDGRRAPPVLRRRRVRRDDAARRVEDGDGGELGVAGSGLGEQRRDAALAERAVVLDVARQHLDRLPVRGEEPVVLRGEALGQELVPRGGVPDRGVVEGADERDPDQDGRDHRGENRAADQDRLQAHTMEHRDPEKSLPPSCA